MTTREHKLTKNIRGFVITFFIFLILRYFLAEILLNHKTNLFEGTIKSICYALAYLTASNIL